MTPAGAVTPAGAMCGAHPDVAAVDVCARCGSFLCGECVEYLGETVYCERCASLFAGDRPSARSRLAIVLGALGIAGMTGGFQLGAPYALIAWGLSAPAGFAGLALAVAEGRGLPDGVPARRRRRVVTVGKVLGVLHGVTVVLVVALFVLFLVLHRR